ncbi:MAG: Gfo/Idh/MocA family oxidoreductase [Gammaproteobacteria bacterium]|nr:Gfo/Idh/MocA family oxidoreductase [Gammaproteobacteria bacterium]
MRMRSAIIGAGRMGRVHLRALRELGHDVVGVADVNREALAETQAEFGLLDAQLFTSAETLLSDARLDLVIVATTAPTHCIYTCQAVQVGANFVLCEKPMAVSLAQCDEMIEKCRIAGARLAINHFGRFRPTFRKIREILASDGFGELASMTVVGGNVGLAMNGSHLIETFTTLTGEPIEEATAWMDALTVANPRGGEFEDRSGTLRFTTKNGRRLTIDCSADQGHGLVVIYAGRTGLCVEDVIAGRMRVLRRRTEDLGLPTTRYATPSNSEDLEFTAADVLEPAKAMITALVEGGDIVDGLTGRKPIEALVAAYESHENGHRAVPLDDNLPVERIFPWA